MSKSRRFSLTKRFTDRKSYVIILACILVIGLSADFIADRAFNENGVAQAPIRERLLARKRMGDAPELTESSRYSTMLYDLCPQHDYYGSLPWSEEVPENPSGRYSFQWRIKLLFDTLFFMDAPKGDGLDYYIKIVSDKGSTVFVKTSKADLPDKNINLVPGVYLVKIDAPVSLTNFRFNFSFSGDPGTREAAEVSGFEKVNLILDRFALKDLDRFLKLCADPPGGVIGRMPRGRVRAVIKNKSKDLVLRARVGLAGRTMEHLQSGFPSVDVNMKPGHAFKGMTSFKLYKIETKCGFHDLIFLSVLKDMSFPVPRGEIVELSVNGGKQGLYALMENPSPAMFLNQSNPEGDIIGVDIDKLFFNYPDGARLDSRKFYEPRVASSSAEEKDLLLSRDFSDRVNKDFLARYIAFASIFSSTHGLGVDDLRFYKNPITGDFFPMPRDLNPGAWYHPTHFKSCMNNIRWLFNQPYYTTYPTTYLRYDEDNPGIPYYINELSTNTTVGVIDIHFVVLNFLSRAENLSLANQYLLYFSDNIALKNKILSRALNLYNRMIINYPDNLYLKELYAKLAKYGLPFYQKHVQNTFKKNKILFKYKKENFFWNLRSSLYMDDDLIPGITVPFTAGVGDRIRSSQLIMSFLCEKKVFTELEKKHDIATKTYKKATYVDEMAEILDADNLFLYDGKTDKSSFFKSGNKETDMDTVFLSNIIVYYGMLPQESGKTIVCFLVRNASEEEKDFVLKRRNGLGAYRPFLNKVFRLGRRVPGVKARSSVNQIMMNHFSPGENLRIVAFRVDSGDEAEFYALESPVDHYAYLPPYIYVPPAGGTVVKDSGISVPDVFRRDGFGFYLPEGSAVDIAEDVIFPYGEPLRIRKGSVIRLSRGKTITVRGDFRVEGEPEDPVTFIGKQGHSYGQIRVVGRADRKPEVIIRNAEFKDCSGLLIYGAFADLDAVRILNSSGEDALNCVSSFADIKDTEISRSYSDAIDLDFTDAFIDNINIYDNMGDGLDISSSLVACRNSAFRNNEDKGVSVGEMSRALIGECVFIGNAFGIANKDQSSLVVKDSLFEKNDTGLGEFIKKPFLGKPVSLRNGLEFRDNNRDYRWMGFYSY